MTTKPLPTSQPVRGPWAWRDYLPTSMKELAALRARALEAAAAGEISLQVAERFISWAWAEMAGDEYHRPPGTQSRYRRLLAELSESAPPPAKRRRVRARGDSGLVDAAQLATSTGRGLLKAQLYITGIAGDDAGDELETPRCKGSEGAEVHTLRPRSAGQGVLDLHTLEELAKAS